MPSTEHRDVVVVGGGLAGLAAAWELRDRDVLLLEADARVGGRVWSQRRGEHWLNFGAHVFSGPESAVGQLIDAVGVRAVDAPGALAALEYGGRLLDRGRVETFPFRMGLRGRDLATLLRVGVKLRLAVAAYSRMARRRPTESAAEHRERILGWRARHTFADWLRCTDAPVLDVVTPTVSRSSATLDQLTAGAGIGYFHLVWNHRGGLSRLIDGGSSTLPEAVAAALGPDRVRTGSEVVAVQAAGDGMRVRTGAGTELTAGSVVLAVPADVAARIGTELPPRVRDALRSVPYGPYVVVSVLTDETEPGPWRDIYALATPQRCFTMLFNQSALRHAEGHSPGSSFMLYASAAPATAFDTSTDAEVRDRFVGDLLAVFPALRGHVTEAVVRRWPRGLPYTDPDRLRRAAALDPDHGRLQLAGDYLGTWYTESAVQTGVEAARRIRVG